MNIKCPNCQTAYVVPDDKVNGKPKKMRCSRCQEVFTVKRRSQKTPLGYQEFTGQQNALPREFAFLRESQLPKAAYPTQSESEPPQEAKVPSPPPIPSKSAFKTATSGYEDFTPELDFDEKKTSPGLAPAPQQVQKQPEQSLSNVVSQVEVETPPPRATSTRSTSDNTSSNDLLGGNAWETEAPLDLGNYAAPSVKSQRMGKTVALVAGAVLLFLFFVMYRNGWNLSPGDLPAQIAFAFSAAEYEEIPQAAKDLELVIGESRLLNRPSGDTLLIVTGTVFNNSPVQRKNIVLHGKLIDTNKDIKGNINTPCNKVFEDSALQKTPIGQIPNLYRKEGLLFNCTIRGESSALFQLVFENVPADYDQNYIIDIKPVSAE